VNQKIAIFAGLLAIALGSSAPVGAQVLPYPAATGLPPYEVVALVRSAGLEPVTRPVRHGPAYVLQAVNKGGKEVRVVVDARTARIVRVVNLGPARIAAAPDVPALPPPYTRPPAGIAAADGYGPNARTAGLEPEVDQAAPYGPIAGTGALPVAPGRAPVANAAPTHAGTPIPRPRPKLAAAEPAASPTIAPASSSSVPAAVPGTGKPVAPAAAPPEPVYEEHE
jgi:hypothetical protein